MLSIWATFVIYNVTFKSCSSIWLLKYILGDKVKEICSILLVSILLTTVISCSAEKLTNVQTTSDEWAGTIRIEGETETIWKGEITVGQIFFNATNVDTATIEEYNLSYPSALGALIAASDIGGFSYSIDYYPSWNAFILTTVKSDSDWWHYWIDYEMPMVGAGDYELTDEDDVILFGYLESWDSHPLKITVDETEVTTKEEFIVEVFNETGAGVEGATVHVGSNAYITDSDGGVTINISARGKYNIYAEKDGFIRSDKKSIEVKSIFELLLERLILFFEWILELLR